MKKTNEKKDGRKKDLLFLLVFFLFSLFIAIFGILCLKNVKNAFVEGNLLWLSLATGAVSGLLYGFSVWFVLAKMGTPLKSVLSLDILLSFALLLCFLLQETGFFTVVGSAESLQRYLEQTGAWMPILYTVLQFLQVIILPIPSFVSTVAGVALFGPFQALIYSLIGILLGSFVAFFIGRKLGYKAVSWMIGEETLKKWQKKLKGKDNFFLTLMFVFPIFPDDVLCFVAGLSSMSTKYFLIMITLSRILGISTTCYSVNFIPINTWWGIAIWVGLATIILLGFFLLYKNLDKIQARLKKKKKED